MNEMILIVDDNCDNRDLAQILLEGEGFLVSTAADAPEALRLLETGCPPDLVLMDVQLPGTDGLELTRRLRQEPSWRDVIVVAFTAYAMASEMEEARAAGCDGYITKPINTRTFADTIRQHLAGSRTPSGVPAL